MFRRLKKDVEISIPSKTEIKVFVPMAELQIGVYKSVLSSNVELLKKFLSTTKAHSSGNFYFFTNLKIN
jgi:SNF2 family DNA or RNA helicase